MLNYKPELYVQYVVDLFTTGKARIGSLKVEPSLACRVYQPPPDKISAVDWVALASVRDSENMILDVASVDDSVAEKSREGEVASWLRQVGYQEVRDDSNYYFCKGLRELQAFDCDISISRDVCLFVNTNMLDDGKNKLRSTLFNHCVVLDERPELRGNQISLSVYSWGDIHRIPSVGSLTIEEFSRNFYGYVSGKPTFN